MVAEGMLECLVSRSQHYLSFLQECIDILSFGIDSRNLSIRAPVIVFNQQHEPVQLETLINSLNLFHGTH